MNNSARLKLYDVMGSAENEEVAREDVHPICQPTEQCKCDNGAASVTVVLNIPVHRLMWTCFTVCCKWKATAAMLTIVWRHQG